MTLFPDHGLPLEVVLDGLAAGARDHDPVRSGPASFSLEVNADLQRVIRTAFARYLTHNPVFGEALPSLARIERELVSMGAEICGGGPAATGFVTLGGSESIFTALHAARERARASGRHGDGPYEVVASETIHPAHAKACHYLGLLLVGVPYRDDLRADVEAMAAAITPATIALCASAPQWPHHRFDDVEAVAALARDRELWCHVDACVGGYLAPFVRAAGWPVPPYDFSVPGVCSMSADLHKWGYAAKPASTVLFADGELARCAPPPPVPWDCGMYATGSVAGSRPGASVAAAWAVLRFLGRDGFTQLASRTMTVRDSIVAGLDAIDGIRTRSTDLAMVVYGGADGVDSDALGDALVRRGWLVMRLVRPEPMLQLLVDRLEDEFVEVFLADVAAAVDEVRSAGSGGTSPAGRGSGAYG
ncbi:MAG: pyridoxal phosphate-dependent decarboxylase family protein [Acidimicrobiales bacterium]